MVRVGGWSLILGALLFVGVFSYLASEFDYPAVLEGPAPEVLPNLRRGGQVMRAVWALYSLLPLAFVPAGAGSYIALRRGGRGRMLVAFSAAVVVAVAMPVGLMRWPSVHWELAGAFERAGPDARTALAAVFTGLNVYLGQYIGEFLGEWAMATFFLLSALSARRRGGFPAWFSVGGVVASTCFYVGALRNLTAAVSIVADLNNVLMPAWMIAFGVGLVRFGGEADSGEGVQHR
jgi:Domain of unknown function (DUF4386)